jgi:arylsulfatase A-like enzyme
VTDEARDPAIDKPNVVLIVVDTLRAAELGVYGHSAPTSPRIDALARKAMVFEKAFSTAPWTTPSVASMLTGLYPRELGIEQRPVILSGDFRTLAETFRDAGYVTHGVISHMWIGSQFGFDQGFDRYDETHLARDRNYVSSPGVTEKAVTFLRERGSEPFFLFVHYFDPHYNYLMHPILNRYAAYSGQLLGRGRTPPDKDFILRLRQLSYQGKLSREDRRYLRALYESEVRFSDHHIGILLDTLAEEGAFDESLIVITGDHGEELADRRDGWIGHTVRLTNEIVHVPLIIKRPGQLEERRVAQPVSLVDLMPTLLEMAGLSSPEGISGRALDIAGTAGGSRDVYAETKRQGQSEMIVSGRWKLVYHRLANQPYRLFDLKADPVALRNVASQHPEVVRQLDAKRLRWSRAQQLKADALTAEIPRLSDAERAQLRELGYAE